jgi:hypothetical protein
MIQVIIPDSDPGSGSCFVTHPGSRIQGSNRHRIPDPDPQQCIFLWCQEDIGRQQGASSTTTPDNSSEKLAEDEKTKTTCQEKQARKAAVQAAKLEKKHLEWELFREDKPTRCHHICTSWQIE